VDNIKSASFSTGSESSGHTFLCRTRCLLYERTHTRQRLHLYHGKELRGRGGAARGETERSALKFFFNAPPLTPPAGGVSPPKGGACFLKETGRGEILPFRVIRDKIQNFEKIVNTRVKWITQNSLKKKKIEHNGRACAIARESPLPLNPMKGY